MRAAVMFLASSWVALLTVAAPSATAETTRDQCVDANTKAQELRRDGKLSAAREQLRLCTDPGCPGIVRDDCTRRLDEVERAQPSLVFDVKSPAGADIIDVRISVDKKPLVSHLDGQPVPVDPGAHEFTFEVEGQPPIVERWLIKEGEAGRHERVVVAARPQEGSAPSATESSGLGARKVLALSLAGAGLVGLGVGTVFGIMASSAWKSAQDACGGDVSHCVDANAANLHHDTAVTDGAISTVGFVAGGALIAAGAVAFLTGGGPDRRPGAGVLVAPSIGLQHAGVALSGEF